MTPPVASMGLESAARMLALKKSGLLDSPSEPAFDRLTALAARALRVPVALISVIDKDRQFFKSQCGLDKAMARHRQTPLSHSFCQHVVLSNEPLVIDDARVHPLVMDNLAVRDLGVIAYAGVPLVDPEGIPLGALCAVDTQPRIWTKNEVDVLRALAAQAASEIALRARIDRLDGDLGAVRRLARFTLHDLRTPLNSLLLNLEAFSIVGELNDEQWECLVTARRNANVLAQLAENLIDIEAMDAGGPAALDFSSVAPADVIAMAADQTKSLAKDKELTLEANAANDLPPLRADEPRLVRVLVNLLANAVKATPSGGAIRVTATARAGGDGDSPGCEFSVTDTGPGIGADEAESIFGHRASDESQPSRGLGLAFCQQVIEAHGGRIWLETGTGAGSDFRFSIPQLQDGSS